MIDVPVYNMSGEQTGSMQIDESLLGGRVRFDLLKQAVVSWQLNQRQGSARTKSRGMVQGSTHKLYRQKGTGNARVGNARTVVRRGGGVAFAKTERNVVRHAMPRKMRQLARNSALLAKLQAGTMLHASKDGSPRYVYADHAGCNCAYVGDTAAYREYNALVVKKVRGRGDPGAQGDEALGGLEDQAAAEWIAQEGLW